MPTNNSFKLKICLFYEDIMCAIVNYGFYLGKKIPLLKSKMIFWRLTSNKSI